MSGSVDPVAQHPIPAPRGRLHRDVVSFARRDGRFSHRNASAWGPEMAGWFVFPERAERSTSLADAWSLDAEVVFGRSAPLVVEIGTGTGDAVLAHAAAHPDWDHLAVEVYRPGLARTVVQAAKRELSNLRVLQGDGRMLVARNLPEASVHELHVWFPDPWPKLRHHKRRMLDEAFFADAALTLEPGGVLRVATDWADYADQIGVLAERSGLFEPAETSAQTPTRSSASARFGATTRYEARPLTRFESKGLALGRDIADFALRLTQA